MAGHEEKPEQPLQTEIARLNRIIEKLMDRVENGSCDTPSGFNLFHTTITLEGEVRKRTEELELAWQENEKVTSALRESEARYRRLIENSHDIIYTLTPEKIITFLSPSWGTLCGCDVGEALGRHISEYIHPDDLKIYLDHLEEVGKTDKHLPDVEYRVRNADGAWRWHISSGTALRNAAGEFIGFEVAAKDITGRKQAENKLVETNHRLEASTIRANALAEEASRANASKSEFLARMSHELRTPLNAIIGFSEIIAGRMMGPCSDKYPEYAADIHASGEHLLSLVNDVLDLSKIESSGFTLKSAPLDLVAIIRDCVSMIGLRVAEKRQKLVNDATAPLPLVKADARAMKQVILNLLSNANKYTQEEGHIHIEAHHDVSLDCVCLTISDNGMGIAPENQELVFEPFHQSGDFMAEEQGGTGLGLAISRRLIELHGGKLELSSALGRGTRISIFLPVLPSSPA